MEHGTVKGMLLPEVMMRVQAPSLALESKPWSLMVTNDPMRGAHFALGDASLIGREPSVAVPLPLSSVSRRHAHLYRKRGGYWLTDLGATNPTRVNGMQITSTPVLDGDLLSIGELSIRLLSPTNAHNEQQFPALEQDTQDALTRLSNRRHLRVAMEQVFAAATPMAEVALVLLDLDHFKHINDRFGYAAGDRVLGVAARVMRDQARGKEQPARIGGEEFAILLPDASKADALRVAERLRMSLAALQLLEDGDPLSITASFGVACVRMDSSNPDALYLRADAALYEAKRLGRNRVVALP